MPLYEYQCQDCDNRFERIEKASSMHDGTCPVCGGTAHRLLGAPALKFKGSGWYVTDYGKGNGRRPAPPETTTETKSESSAAAPTGSKASASDKPASSAPSKVA